MSVTSALRTRLLAVSGVSALTTRIYQGHARRNAALPYVVLVTIGGSPHHHLTAAAPIGEAAIQIDAYAATGSAVVALAEAIRNAADGWAGSSGGIAIDQIILDPPSNSIEGLDAGRESPKHRSRIDARVFFAQAAPTL